MTKSTTLVILFMFAISLCNAQSYCFCDTTNITNYVDTSYLNDGIFVKYRIDRETRNKYIIKTHFTPDTHRVIFQINDSLLSDGETCSWYTNGKLKHRLVFRNNILVGTNNFGWYNNGSINFHLINISDTIKTVFYSQKGRLSYEELGFEGLLLTRKDYYPNGNIKEFRNFINDTVQVINYYNTGVLKSIGYYWYSKQVGDYFEFYDDGSLKEKGKFFYRKNVSNSFIIKNRKVFKRGKHFEGSHLFK